MAYGDLSPSGYLSMVVPKNASFAQRRVARLNPTRHAAATAVYSRSSRDGVGRVGIGVGGVCSSSSGQQKAASCSSVCGWARQQLFGAGLWRGACTGWEKGLWLEAWPPSSGTCMVKAEVQASGINLWGAGS